MNAKRGGPLEPPHHRLSVTIPDDPTIVAERLFGGEQGHRERQIVRLAEQAMPLARYYSCHGGPLLAVPIGDYYVRGRWAA